MTKRICHRPHLLSPYTLVDRQESQACAGFCSVLCPGKRWNGQKQPDDCIPEGKMGLIPVTQLLPYSWPQRTPNARGASPSLARTSHCCEPSYMVHTEPAVRDGLVGAPGLHEEAVPRQTVRGGIRAQILQSDYLIHYLASISGMKAGHWEP